jgi:hypothetical protein
VYPNETYKFPWDDLRAPASSINPAGQTAGADIDSTDSTLLFASNATETAAVILQMPHAWREGSTISPHIHASKTTDAAGEIAWQIRYRVIGIGEVPPDWSDWQDWEVRSEDPGATQTHVLYAFPDITMTGQTLSTIISVQIQRDHDNAADTYEADARLWEFDIHYRSDGLGSIEEFSKVEVS